MSWDAALQLLWCPRGVSAYPMFNVEFKVVRPAMHRREDPTRREETGRRREGGENGAKAADTAPPLSKQGNATVIFSPKHVLPPSHRDGIRSNRLFGNFCLTYSPSLGLNPLTRQPTGLVDSVLVRSRKRRDRELFLGLHVCCVPPREDALLQARLGCTADVVVVLVCFCNT